MSRVKKKPTFAELCLEDHKKVIGEAIRKVIAENQWLIKDVARECKCSTATAWKLFNNRESTMTLDMLCLMAYDLGIAVGIRLVNPNQ